MEKNWLEEMAKGALAEAVLETNRYTQKYGLVLGKEEAALLAQERANALREERRVDDELLEFMREQFEKVCCGDFGYLEGTCLDLFAQAIRAGYSGYRESGGRGEFEAVDIVKRWDRELYLEALHNLF